jgi:hypothetical protein
MRLQRLILFLILIALPLLAQPARKRSAPRPATPAAQPKLPPITPLVMLAILHSPRPAPQLHLVPESTLARIAPGQSRDSVIDALGQPNTVSRVQGLDDGPRERLTYHLSATRTAAVHVEAGRVVAVTRN